MAETVMEGNFSLYDRIGGEPVLRRVVARFYALMDTLPEAEGIRRLHPEDLSVSEEKLFKFLSGWLGGPPLYQREYGHPRLRARHLPFVIGERERDAWMLCMTRALEEVDMDTLLRMQLRQSLHQVADHMINRREGV